MTTLLQTHDRHAGELRQERVREQERLMAREPAGDRKGSVAQPIRIGRKITSNQDGPHFDAPSFLGYTRVV
jgi:hypothetical protein